MSPIAAGLILDAIALVSIVALGALHVLPPTVIATLLTAILAGRLAPAGRALLTGVATDAGAGTPPPTASVTSVPSDPSVPKTDAPKGPALLGRSAPAAHADRSATADPSTQPSFAHRMACASGLLSLLALVPAAIYLVANRTALSATGALRMLLFTVGAFVCFACAAALTVTKALAPGLCGLLVTLTAADGSFLGVACQGIASFVESEIQQEIASSSASDGGTVSADGTPLPKIDLAAVRKGCTSTVPVGEWGDSLRVCPGLEAAAARGAAKALLAGAVVLPSPSSSPSSAPSSAPDGGAK